VALTAPATSEDAAAIPTAEGETLEPGVGCSVDRTGHSNNGLIGAMGLAAAVLATSRVRRRKQK
jgi:MYXO-CTERM domain-containing protein